MEAEGLCDLGQATRPPYAASTQVCLRGKAEDEEMVHVRRPTQRKYWKSPGVQLLVW